MSDTQGGRRHHEWLAGAATFLSLATCYGTMGLVGILSLMGVTLAVNAHVWAAAIVLFALLAVAGVALGYRRHRSLAPLGLAAVGALLVTVAMYASGTIVDGLGLPARAVELVGFAGLVAAAVWDWRLKLKTSN
jgi:hypothetical protein